MHEREPQEHDGQDDRGAVDGDDGRAEHGVHHLREVLDAELHDARRRAHDARVRLEQAAIEAEIATGRHEETIEQARAGVLKRTLRMSLGTIVLVAGLLMLALPGPGWLTVAAGLAILSRDVAWAERLLERVRRRLPQDEDGGVSKPVIATSVVVALAAVAASLWFTFG